MARNVGQAFTQMQLSTYRGICRYLLDNTSTVFFYKPHFEISHTFSLDELKDQGSVLVSAHLV